MPDSLGALMDPMKPQSRNPSIAQQTMVAPNAPPQAAMPPPPPPNMPPQGIPQGVGMPPVPPAPPGMPPAPMGANPMSAIMPRQMPDIIQLLMRQVMNDAPGTQVAPGLQSAPVRGTTETIGGR